MEKGTNTQALEEMIPVDSSNLLAMGYNAGNQLLTVRFKGGGLYEYEQVPPEIFELAKRTIQAGGSLGKWFARYIKAGGYRFRVVNAKQTEARQG